MSGPTHYRNHTLDLILKGPPDQNPVARPIPRPEPY